jgi:pantoate--beta-alanine ligase
MVVSKLFNIVQPNRAYFGAKDFQQTAIIQRITADLNFPIEIVVCPTVREADGLAMSSRNRYLSPQERAEAPALYGALTKAADSIRAKHPLPQEVEAAIRSHIFSRAPLGTIEYVEIVDPLTLCSVETTNCPVVIALAVKFGRARLIDNILVNALPGT